MTAVPSLHRHVGLVVDQFRIYDGAVREWITGIESLLGAGETIHAVFATPDRAFATLSHLWERRYGKGDPSRLERLRLNPYPIAAISRSSLRPEPDRSFGRHNRHRGVVRSADQTSVFGYTMPRPWGIDYQIDVETRNRATMNMVQMWAMEEVSSPTMLRVDLTPVWAEYGVKVVPFEATDITDNSDLDPGEEDRSLRLTISGTLHAWLFLPPEETKSVLRVVQDAFAVQRGADIEADAATIVATPARFVPLETTEYDQNGAIP